MGHPMTAGYLQAAQQPAYVLPTRVLPSGSMHQSIMQRPLVANGSQKRLYMTHSGEKMAIHGAA